MSFLTVHVQKWRSDLPPPPASNTDNRLSPKIWGSDLTPPPDSVKGYATLRLVQQNIPKIFVAATL